MGSKFHTKLQADLLARGYSLKYSTVWYVREVKPGEFEPWAHDLEDGCTHSAFHCGRRLKDEATDKLNSTIRMVRKVNSDCAETGESVVPISASNAKYYKQMLSNLDYPETEIKLFLTWLKKQKESK